MTQMDVPVSPPSFLTCLMKLSRITMASILTKTLRSLRLWPESTPPKHHNQLGESALQLPHKWLMSTFIWKCWSVIFRKKDPVRWIGEKSGVLSKKLPRKNGIFSTINFNRPIKGCSQCSKAILIGEVRHAIGGALAIVVHTAYHLGEIRQALCTVK